MRLIIPPGKSETRPPSRFMAINARDIWLSVQQLLLLFFFFFFFVCLWKRNRMLAEFQEAQLSKKWSFPTTPQVSRSGTRPRPEGPLQGGGVCFQCGSAP